MLEVVYWASEQAAGRERLLAVALVVQATGDEDLVRLRSGRGLIWLLGQDANGVLNEADESASLGMHARRAARRKQAR